MRFVTTVAMVVGLCALAPTAGFGGVPEGVALAAETQAVPAEPPSKQEAPTPATDPANRLLLLQGAQEVLERDPIRVSVDAADPSEAMTAISAPWLLAKEPMSTTDRALMGMGKAASLVGAIGAFGSSFGWWEDKDAWKMIAAAAAAGATLGGLGIGVGVSSGP